MVNTIENRWHRQEFHDQRVLDELNKIYKPLDDAPYLHRKVENMRDEFQKRRHVRVNNVYNQFIRRAEQQLRMSITSESFDWLLSEMKDFPDFEKDWGVLSEAQLQTYRDMQEQLLKRGQRLQTSEKSEADYYQVLQNAGMKSEEVLPYLQLAIEYADGSPKKSALEAELKRW